MAFFGEICAGEADVAWKKIAERRFGYEFRLSSFQNHQAKGVVSGRQGMKHSTERILVSHVGSLARPKDLMEMLVARNEGHPFDAVALARRTRESVAEVVAKQIECGIDVVNDGE